MLQPASATAAPTSLWAPGVRAATVGALALVSMLAFEAVAVAAAMPAIATALDGLSQYALAFGGTLALSVLGMVWAGPACDRHGPWRACSVGLGVFALGLLVAGLAPQMGWLSAGRAVQGLGVGMLAVALYAGMGRVLPAALHPKLFAALAAAWVVPGLIGPWVAAQMVSLWGWRSVFLGVALLLLPTAWMLLPALRRVPVLQEGARAAVALPWAVVAALSALALHGMEQIGPWAWLGLLALVPAAARLLPAGSLTAQPGLPAVIALRGVMAASFFSAEAFIPLFLNQEAGWSLAEGGLALSAAAVTWSTGSAIQARLHGEPARRTGLRVGLALLVAGQALLAGPLLAGGPAGWVVVGWAVAGLGVGLAWPMLSVLTLALSAPAEQGRNSSALQLADALTTTVALAAAGAFFAQQHAYGAVLAWTVALAAVGLWVTVARVRG
ncbi:MFS transporter [Inhella gelatinilytica]|uniref:MFS transporter n=1 Tax=Inhella gelatinilytica TaxID=2795030 RepID=A0A931NCY1_9BURK|nr:MFS transporter [Inhella gelatinilytica]MBH9552019.1 MFS transporter [Inhella gelatinilytica]